jgi:hypothetical protein
MKLRPFSSQHREMFISIDGQPDRSPRFRARSGAEPGSGAGSALPTAARTDHDRRVAAAGLPGIGTTARRGPVRAAAHTAGAYRVRPGRADRVRRNRRQRTNHQCGGRHPAAGMDAPTPGEDVAARRCHPGPHRCVGCEPAPARPQRGGRADGKRPGLAARGKPGHALGCLPHVALRREGRPRKMRNQPSSSWITNR